MILKMIILFFFAFVGGYIIEEHWSDYGLWHARKEPDRCFFAVVDDSYVLTLTSCFASNSTVPTGNFYRLINGEEVEAYRLIGLRKYPYENVFDFEISVDDFLVNLILVKLDRRMNVKDVKTKWPNVFIDKDFEDILDGFEEAQKTANIWTRPNKPIGPPIEVQSGRLANRKECMESFKAFCARALKEEQCQIVAEKVRFRCLVFTWNICWNHRSSSAPVIVDDVLWGFVTICTQNVVYYQGLDRSFAFVHEILNSSKLKMDERFAFVVIFVLSALTILVFVAVIKITISNRREKERQKKEIKVPIPVVKKQERKTFF